MIRRYEDSDFPMIESWFLKRGLEILPNELPEIGFIRNNAAAGFLYETGTKIALIENVVTNPDVSMFERYNGVREVAKKLIEIARFRKYRLFSVTRSSGISRIAQSLGFVSRGCYEILDRGY